MLTLICYVASFGNAAVTMPNVFSDHMVLQQGKPISVWGWAEPYESVTVDFKGITKKTTAGSEGRWDVELPAFEASSESAQLRIEATNTVVISDILVGEIWICSGQSNMEWNLNSAETGAKAVAAANFPQIRLLKINSRPCAWAVRDIDNKWLVCSPQTVGDFTAIGYFFGKHLHEELSVPVGLIQAAWGGTRIEPWIPREGFEQVDALVNIVRHIDQAHKNYRENLPVKMLEIEKWINEARKALKIGKTIPLQPEWPRHSLYSEGHPTEPTCLYNSRIFPIVPLTHRGAIWYQGESNIGEGMLYYDKMKALIGGWRAVFGQSDLSFYYVQLAPYRHYGSDALPAIWEAQTAALGIPNTGMVVINDIGNIEDIHPRNKRDVGDRLALWALAKNYGRGNLVYSGPLYRSMAVKGDKIEITFDHVGPGLTTRDGKTPDWFEIAGSDKLFRPAQVRIVSDKVEVWSDEVSAPVAVRFAWDNIAQPNLMNKAGLPASAFRTDKW
ncbi:hypothetical protein AMJ44_02930 [candidate division WOR-1 bacterium DG_54_3]|uniref:Sialate O-acetylesterase domain-containing protein n=1 Tax=candidate division WOR-1 bacterium DG_54_3 TaxID=1703775 RepID=A0A0S7Y4L3_UNCSA|nr:MAG: hypothetical protein AMJ44_02930 [candidate division WOR-1 bacterium DG_54_3]